MLSGDFAKLGLLVANLRKLAEVPSQAARVAATGIDGLLRKQFAAGMDPYGRPWAPLSAMTRRRGRMGVPLTDSGALASGTRAKPMGGAGIQITIGASYGGFHQSGTRRMPARPILPIGALPAAWAKIIRDAVALASAKILGRAG